MQIRQEPTKEVESEREREREADRKGELNAVRGAARRRQRINYKRLHINANLTTEAVQETGRRTNGQTDSAGKRDGER